VLGVPHEKLEELFSAALQKRTPAERSSYLEDACAGDHPLRTRVEELLRAHERSTTFLDSPVIDPDATLAHGGATEPAVAQIGPYKIHEEIGEGGFGIVYLAEQEAPVRRKVALKVIKLGMDTREVIARFEAERQALALMDHPNIARVLDAGATDAGRPYFVMELVRGVTLTDYCRDNRLSVRQRIELLLPVCHAVQHAHQKGIIHRDLKPNNVLVTLHEDHPLPKVIDFGIAKATSQRLTEKTLYTEFRQFLGTPEYMSPDQADISGLDVDTRTDIYSLGVMLYELLTGTTPFDPQTLRAAGYDEIKRTIREVDPPKPSLRIAALLAADHDLARRYRADPGTLKRLIRGDLDWIVMKALEKDRTRRYQSVSEFAADLERHLRHEPVLAGPPGLHYRLSKFARRNQTAVLASGIVATALLAGIALASIGYIQSARARDAFRAQRDAANAARWEAEAARAAEQEQRDRAEQSALQARADASRFAAANTFLRDMLASVDPSRVRGREVSVRYVLDEATRRVAEGALADQPEVEAGVRITLGNTYQALGEFQAARDHVQAALERYRAVLGDEHPDTLRARSQLAELLIHNHQHAEAAALARDTLAAQSAALGEDHPDTLATLGRLGVALSQQDKLSEAERVLQHALELQTKVLGADAVETLRSQVNLGTVYQAQGRYAAAESLLRSALARQRQRLDPEHPDVMETMNALALTLESQAKYAEAEDLFRQSWELDQRILGADHPLTQIPMNNLLRVLRIQGKIDETRPVVTARLARLRRTADRPNATALDLHAYVRELLECQPEDLRDPQTALPYARRAVDLDAGRSIDLLETLAHAYQMSGDLGQAVAAQREAVAVARATGSMDRAAAEGRLRDLLLEKGDFVAAAGLAVTDVAVQIGRTVAEDYASVGAALADTAEAHISAGRYTQAEELLLACYTTRQKELPPDHWLLSQTESLLGEALAGQGRFGEAEVRLLAAYRALTQDPRVSTYYLRAARQRIVRLYEAWGKPDQAAAWSAEVDPVRPPPP